MKKIVNESIDDVLKPKTLTQIKTDIINISDKNFYYVFIDEDLVNEGNFDIDLNNYDEDDKDYGEYVQRGYQGISELNVYEYPKDLQGYDVEDEEIDNLYKNRDLLKNIGTVTVAFDEGLEAEIIKNDLGIHITCFLYIPE